MSALGDWLTVEEAAKASGYHPNHIRRLVRKGHIDAQKWGATWMVSKVSLLNYLDKMETQGDKRGPKSGGY